VLVKGLHRSVLFVPKRDVFDDADGETARLEQVRQLLGSF
jgi:hypothetical protein